MRHARSRNARKALVWVGLLIFAAVCNGCDATSTQLTSSCDPCTVDIPIALSATVRGSGGPATGTVLFEEGANVLAHASLNTTGTAAATITGLAVGTHNLRAVYLGGGKYTGSTSNTVMQAVGPIQETPILETVFVPPPPGTSGGILTSISWGGSVPIHPTDAVQLRLRAAWPTLLQLFINGQQLTQLASGAPPPQPDDAGYYTVSVKPLPNDNLSSFLLIDLKLPSQFRFTPGAFNIPGFTLTIRDSAFGLNASAADLIIPMDGYCVSPCHPAEPVPPQPTKAFRSGENSKDSTDAPSHMPRTRLGTTAIDVTVAGWLDIAGDDARGPDLGGGRSEDWHFSLLLDPDFIERNYTSASTLPVFGATLRGQPEDEACWYVVGDSGYSCPCGGPFGGPFNALPGCTHMIPFTNNSPPDVGSFLIPGSGDLTVELNAWHTDTAGNPPGRGPVKGYFEDPRAADVPPAFLNNAWAFPVLTGTILPGERLHRPLKVGDYLIVKGTLWQDIAHLKSETDPYLFHLRGCYDSALPAQGGWLEIHPPDVVRFVPHPPALRRHPEVIAVCANTGESNFLNRMVGPDLPAPTPHSVLQFREVADSRFANVAPVEHQIQVDPCDPTKLDVNLRVDASGQPAFYKSVLLVWWAESSTPPPQPSCSPQTFSTLELNVGNGSVPLPFYSSITVDLLGPDQLTPFQTIELKPFGPGWWSDNTKDQVIQLKTPLSVSSISGFTFRRSTAGDPYDWNLQTAYARLLNEGANGNVAQQACLLNQVGNQGVNPLATLTNQAPTATFLAFAGCRSIPVPQFVQTGGSTTCPEAVAIINSDPTSSFFFTTDGTTPTGASAQYKNPIPITQSEVLSAVAISRNGGASPIATIGFFCPGIQTLAKRYDSVEVRIQTGNDILSQFSSATIDMLGPGDNPTTVASFPLKSLFAPAWKANTITDLVFRFNSPEPASALGGARLNLTQGSATWNVMNVYVRIFNQSGDQVCLINQGGTSIWQKLKGGDNLDLRLGGCW